MRSVLMAVAFGGLLAGSAAAQSSGNVARPPQRVLPPPKQPIQNQAERERSLHEQGLADAEMFRRRESGLDERRPSTRGSR